MSYYMRNAQYNYEAAQLFLPRMNDDELVMGKICHDLQMAIELVLKSFIARSGKKHRTDHSMSHILAEAKSIGLMLQSGEEELIGSLTEWHAGGSYNVNFISTKRKIEAVCNLYLKISYIFQKTKSATIGSFCKDFRCPDSCGLLNDIQDYCSYGLHRGHADCLMRLAATVDDNQPVQMINPNADVKDTPAD